MKSFLYGVRSMSSITAGIAPFGAIVGAVCANAGVSLLSALSMNMIVFAGASQLVAVELMSHHAQIFFIVMSGLIINTRFILYSAVMSVHLKDYPLRIKMLTAYLLTDQNFAILSVHRENLKSNAEVLSFYFGGSLYMILVWYTSVILGHMFGNLAPISWQLDFAVPLSLMALTIPAIKNRSYFIVANFSGLTSLMLKDLPYHLGLIVTASLAIVLGIYLSRRKNK